jgi:hypothetical protein
MLYNLIAQKMVGFSESNQFTFIQNRPSSNRRDIALQNIISCFLGFWKVFDFVPLKALFQRLKDIGISETLLIAIMHLYELVIGHLYIAHGASNFIKSTVEVK